MGGLPGRHPFTTAPQERTIILRPTTITSGVGRIPYEEAALKQRLFVLGLSVAVCSLLLARMAAPSAANDPMQGPVGSDFVVRQSLSNGISPAARDLPVIVPG